LKNGGLETNQRLPVDSLETLGVKGMSEEREVRKETDFWGNEKEVIYENNQKVGEVRTEERGGFLGIGAETVKVEYDNSGSETSYTRIEERGGFLGIGSEETQVRYDSSNQEIGQSRVEARGGFLGMGGHHVRVEYDANGNEVSQTNTELRGDFLGFGGDRRRVTRYNTAAVAPNTRISGTADRSTNSSSSNRSDSASGGSFGILLGVLGIIAFIAWMQSERSSGPQDSNQSVSVSNLFPEFEDHKWSNTRGCPDGGWIELTFIGSNSIEFFYGNSVELLDLTGFDGTNFVGLDETRSRTSGVITSQSIEITSENPSKSASYFLCRV
jgi:hypothetical protein